MLQRLRFGGHELPSGSAVSVFQIEDGSSLSVRYLIANPVSERDALLLHRRPADLSRDSIVSLGLSRRESELLLGVASGLTNLELAERHSISERTVEKHLSHVYFKLGVETRTAAVARAHQAARDS